jgi:copper transport protein
VVRALALALVALALVPAAASAHATLEATSPARGAQLKAAPAQVVFTFDETVEAAFGAVRVYDGQGKEVQNGAAFHPNGIGKEVAVKLKPGLKAGSYTATYRVISADGHIVSSGFVFQVGDAGGPSESVDQLLAGQKTGRITDTALAVARGTQYGAIALGLGMLAFLLLCWIPGVRMVAGAGGGWEAASRAFAGRTRRLLLAAAIAGLISAAVAILLEGALGEGKSVWSALSTSVVKETLGTRFGTAWGLGFLAWAVVAVLAALPDPVPALQPASVGATGLALPSNRTRLALLALPLVALALLPSMGGHASVQSPVPVLLPANLLHVLAMSAWLGGIAVLVLALRAATARLEDPSDRTRLLASVVSRFSAVALLSIAVLLATGVIQAIVEVQTFPHLLDTAFGRAVLIKAIVAIGIVALGYLNRSRTLPALRAAGGSPGRAGVALRRTLRVELALGVTAIAVTGALSGYPPSIAVASGPFSGNVTFGPIHMETTVDPAQPGANAVHVYLFDAKTGAPFAKTKELTMTAALPSKGIAPIPLTARIAGPGHYVIEGATLTGKGTWKFSVVDRVSDFDEYTTSFNVPIK